MVWGVQNKTEPREQLCIIFQVIININHHSTKLYTYWYLAHSFLLLRMMRCYMCPLTGLYSIHDRGSGFFTWLRLLWRLDQSVSWLGLKNCLVHPTYFSSVHLRQSKNQSQFGSGVHGKWLSDKCLTVFRSWAQIPAAVDSLEKSTYYSWTLTYIVN